MPSNTKGRGVLPINAAQTRKPFKQGPRPPAPRLKLIIRRLPPGLTEAEFWECIGADWHVGQGKIDWAAFKPGKISKDLAKPSRPGRAYLKVKEPAHLDLLSAHVKAVTFQDAKNSTRDSCLVGPPSLEFAPYNKVSTGRRQPDKRQGTIDQDPEFIDFLQSLTEPITKAAANGDADGKPEKVTITPLIQYIKDKKANKAKEKEAAAAKASKKGQDVKDAKNTSPSKSEQTTVVKKTANTDAEKARVAKATQQAVDSIKRSVAEIKGQAPPTKQEQQAAAKAPTTPTQPTPKRERQRGDASAAARIIGRDLGLVPKEGRIPRTPRAVSTPTGSTNTPLTGPAAIKSPPPQSVATPASPQTPSTPPQPPTGPRNLRNATLQPSPLRPSPLPQPTKSTKPPPQPSSGAKSAFLKHANPSQGVTEELLRSTFSTYGTLTRCEIDKKKGLAYVDFTDTDGLRKAMAASPVKVGNSNVVVLENRSPYKKAAQPGSRPNTGSPITSNASSPRVAHASLASVAEQAGRPVTPAGTSTESTKTDATAVAPTTPSTAAPPLTDSTSLASVSPAQPPSAPRGNNARGTGTPRGNFRGRGFRGRGGQYGRGGNRAASTPVGNMAQSGPSTPGAATGGGAGNGDAKS
ncbi:hypothetical protein PMZ80_001585 [Knufia obscura]|uniref:RRM domain-containing protein n=1 Tax=Knufia obscura TaxID=1635080 RepID=A0ABR0S4J9_9EURO|nr:hypothetical protein PMZ80_001585 [Knufia obscura]